jgi:Ca2+-binding RTX toxin-like protein
MAQGPSQGLNLGGQPQAYGDTFSALNLFHGADAWIVFPNGVETRGAQLAVDSQGWLKELPVFNGQQLPVVANVFYTKILPAGDYIVEWKGEGILSTYSNTESLGENKYRIKWEGSSATNESGISLIIEQTDPNKTGNYIRDIKIYKEEHSDLVAMGEKFDPNWFQAIDDFRVLRTHDWQGTNFTKATNPTINDFTSDQAFWIREGRGMPIELLVETANQARADLWINVPHMATDEYMRQMAQYVKDNLAKDLNVYVEYTNEYWTTIFDQHPYLIQQGQQKFGDVPFANAQAYGARASEMIQIFKQVFGAEQTRLIPTVTLDDTAFNTAEAITMLTTPAYVAKGGISPLAAGVKFLSTDGYLGWFNSDPSIDSLVDQWMTQPDKGFGSARDYLLEQLNTSLIPNWQAGRALADQYGLKFGVYEGGALIQNGLPGSFGLQKYTDFNAAFQLSAEMRAVYEAELAAWQSVGSGPFAWYSDAGRVGPWGDYGLWNAPDFIPEPRAEAIIGANTNTPAWWTGDNRSASIFENGKYDIGTTTGEVMNGTNLSDRLYSIDGNDQINGLGGADRLVGGNGNDTLNGGDGDDALHGGAGADILKGEAGTNTLFGDAGADNLQGGRGKDTLYGGNENDILTGGLGTDDIFGGAGTDVLVFINSRSGVTVNLLTGAGFGGEAEGDSYFEVENILGSNLVDVLTARSAGSNMVGYGGNDILNGDAGGDLLTGGLGADTINGFGGNDRVYYNGSSSFVTVNLTTNVNTGGEAQGDLLSNVEEIYASAFNDTLTGDAKVNLLFGQVGNDRLDGQAGADILYGGVGSDSFVFAFGQSGTTAATADQIADYAKGAVAVGDKIDIAQALTIGGVATAATAALASINATTGVATFAAGSGTTLADALADIATSMTTGTNTAGEFVFFKVNNTGNFYQFISDGVAGVGANDVLVQFTGITTINTINLTSGDLTILT